MKNELKIALLKSIEQDIKNQKKVGLFFSGGIDSSLIGKILIDLKIDVTPITVGLKNSKDVLAAKNSAKNIFKKHVVICLDEEIIEKTIPKVIEITKSYDVVTISVGCVIYLASKYASMFGLKTVFTGTGSDEIFCGYQSHQEALKKSLKDVEKECKTRLKDVEKDLERDKKITESFGLKLKTPFLNKKTVEIGMKIPVKKKIDKKNRKIIIRKIAKEMGITSEIYKRKKKAAQYGSGVQKIIKKISKKHGFNTVGDFLKNLYKKQKSM